MTYAANSAEVQHGAAIYVDKILKGAKPADLPVEQPTRFELVITLKLPSRLASPFHRPYSAAPTRSSNNRVRSICRSAP